MTMNEDDPYADEPEVKPFWRCEECGFEDKKKLIPQDRNKFYEKLHTSGAPKCPKSKSETFIPVGF